MLVDSRCPPTTALARRHNPPTPLRQSRRQVADHAALAAATATASGRPPIRGARSPTATQNRLNPTANSSARQANRRRQSRTVVCAKPNPPADRRIPTPPHIVSSAEPITSTASRRPQVKNPGNKARACPHSTGPGAPTAGGSPRRSPATSPLHTIPKTASAGGICGQQSGQGTTTPHDPPPRTCRHPARLAIRSPSAHSPSGPLPMSDQLSDREGPCRVSTGSCRSSPAAIATVQLPSPRAESVLNYPGRIKPLRPHQDVPVTTTSDPKERRIPGDRAVTTRLASVESQRVVCELSVWECNYKGVTVLLQ